jgi:hypothetical protein
LPGQCIIYGIGALGDANIFANGQRFVFSNLNAMGWVLIVLGLFELFVSGPNPWWSLAVFFLCIYVIHGVFIYGADPADRNP